MHQLFLNHSNPHKNKDITTLYSNNYNNLNNQTNYLNHHLELGTKTRAHNDTNNNITKYEHDDMSNYYDINKINDKTNEIDGLYIEPPFM